MSSLLMICIAGCATTPITNRPQLLLVPESEEIALGLDSFSQIIADERLSTNRQWTEMVNRVGRRLAAAAERPDYQWEFQVIQSTQQNAFCLPGGKVAVYEGILPVCQSEAGLAVVMAHEVAHALARHGGERMSQTYVVDGMGKALSHLNQTHQVVSHQQLTRAYGIASEYGFVLPYSRKHESEADHMGILLMANAGYDPREAPRFWQRFGSIKTESQPEFLSTHPNDERRAADLLELLPEASALYEQSPTKFGLGSMISFTNGTTDLKKANAAAPTSDFQNIIAPVIQAGGQGEPRIDLLEAATTQANGLRTAPAAPSQARQIGGLEEPTMLGSSNPLR